MGTMMRRYWVPSLLSWELPEPDCPPVEVRLLGEDLIAFRDTQGRVGMVSAFCAHRRASLFWGRNEEDGIRCVYHGWKYDVTGRCVDMPSEPPESTFKERVKIPAYPTFEAGGVVWTYMGSPELQPDPPLFEWTQVPSSRRSLSKVIEECNWLQCLEGGIDGVHSNFLHGGRPPGLRYDEDEVRGRANNISTALSMEVVPTDYGYSYATRRTLGDGSSLVRGYHLVFPWTQIRSSGEGRIAGHMWVPIDDFNTMVFNYHYDYIEGLKPHRNHPARPAEANPLWYRDAEMMDLTGNNFLLDIDPTTFRSIRNRANRYLIDRQVQKTQTFTGIQGINTQDRAVQESMGAVADRSLERLGTSDTAIIAYRRHMLNALRRFQEGVEPPGTKSTYYKLRALEKVLPDNVNWYEAMKGELYQLEESPPTLTPSPVT
jgi:nitrite reductase/ring-hydroxylating ferredoxin subunit